MSWLHCYICGVNSIFFPAYQNNFANIIQHKQSTQVLIFFMFKGQLTQNWNLFKKKNGTKKPQHILINLALCSTYDILQHLFCSTDKRKLVVVRIFDTFGKNNQIRLWK